MGTIIYSIVYSGVDQIKRQSSASLAFVRGINRWPVKFPAQMVSNAGNVSIWWRHHDSALELEIFRSVTETSTLNVSFNHVSYHFSKSCDAQLLSLVWNICCLRVHRREISHACGCPNHKRFTVNWLGKKGIVGCHLYPVMWAPQIKSFPTVLKQYWCGFKMWFYASIWWIMCRRLSTVLTLWVLVFCMARNKNHVSSIRGIILCANHICMLARCTNRNWDI